jgi:hypothetical protein
LHRIDGGQEDLIGVQLQRQARIGMAHEFHGRCGIDLRPLKVGAEGVAEGVKVDASAGGVFKRDARSVQVIAKQLHVPGTEDEHSALAEVVTWTRRTQFVGQIIAKGNRCSTTVLRDGSTNEDEGAHGIESEIIPDEGTQLRSPQASQQRGFVEERPRTGDVEQGRDFRIGERTPRALLSTDDADLAHGPERVQMEHPAAMQPVQERVAVGEDVIERARRERL